MRLVVEIQDSIPRPNIFFNVSDLLKEIPTLVFRTYQILTHRVWLNFNEHKLFCWIKINCDTK
jgi:hypothetical protein